MKKTAIVFALLFLSGMAAHADGDLPGTQDSQDGMAPCEQAPMPQMQNRTGHGIRHDAADHEKDDRSPAESHGTCKACGEKGTGEGTAGDAEKKP